MENKRWEEKMLLATTLNLFRQICSDKWTDEAQEEIEKPYNLSSSNIRISKTDLENFVKKNTLKLRFHLSALINIIEQDIFENDEAKNLSYDGVYHPFWDDSHYAIEQKVNLEQKQPKFLLITRKIRKGREKGPRWKSQTTIVNLLKKSKS